MRVLGVSKPMSSFAPRTERDDLLTFDVFWEENDLVFDVVRYIRGANGDNVATV